MLDSEGFGAARSSRLDFTLDLDLCAVWMGHLTPKSPAGQGAAPREARERSVQVDGQAPPAPAPAAPAATAIAIAADDATCQSSAVVVGITYLNRVFDDNAHGLRAALLVAPLGLAPEQVLVLGDFSLARYRGLAAACRRRGRTMRFLQVALGPHELTVLTPHYIAFHMEQVGPRPLSSPPYSALSSEHAAGGLASLAG